MKKLKFIKSIKTIKKEILPGKLGYETNIILSTLDKRKFVLSHCDATGSSFSKIESINIAISEAFERHIYYKLLKSKKSNYGFDVNNTTDGFAAIPRYFSKEGVKSSYHEAIERWAIREWWGGKLNCHILNGQGDYRYFEIATPFENTRTLILEKCIDMRGPRYVYGFACSDTLKSAIKSAEKELVRNINIIKHSALFTKNYSITLSLQERRLLYFSTKEGNDLFNIRVMSQNKDTWNSCPDIIFKGEIAHDINESVLCYRTLFQNKIKLKGSEDEFYF